MKDDVFRRAKKKTNSGGCGGCNEKRKPLTDKDIERQRRKHKTGSW